MLKKIGLAISLHPVITIVIWVIAITVLAAGAFTGFGQGGLFDRLESGHPSVASESKKADDLMIGASGEKRTEQFYLMLNGVEDRNNINLINAVEDLVVDLEDNAYFESFVSPIGIPKDMLKDVGLDGFIAGNDVISVITYNLTSDENLKEDAERRKEFVKILNDYEPILKKYGVESIQIANPQLYQDSFIEQAQQDLKYGELVSLPLALIALLFIFGGVLAAITPLIGAGASIVSSLGVLWLLSFVMPIDTTTLNLVSVVGLALAIDFSLLMVNRYREIIGEYRYVTKRTIALAIARTMDTAGRTVIFSGITVALCLAALLAFNMPFLTSIAYAGVAVALLGVLSATLLLPALFRLYGVKLLKKSRITQQKQIKKFADGTSIDNQKENGAFAKISRIVRKAPAIFLLVGIGLLALLGSGLKDLHLSLYDSPSFSKSPPAASAFERLDDFPAFQSADVILVFPASTQYVKNQTPELLEFYEEAIMGERISDGIDTSTLEIMSLDGNDYATMKFDLLEGADSTKAITELREYIASHNDENRVWVTGNKARDLDFANAIGENAWKAILIVALVTFVLMFLLTGSILIPIMTVILSTASLGASIGVLTWGFVDGGLQHVLGFTGIDIIGLSPVILVLSLLFSLALANDYSVFLTARIKEEWDKLEKADHGNKENAAQAVILGTQHTGKIITSAGVLMIICFSGFAFSGIISGWFEGTGGGLLMIQQIGVSLAVGVAVDVLIVRTFLVPAFMFMFGRSMWSAPAWMKEVYEQFGVKH